MSVTICIGIYIYIYINCNEPSITHWLPQVPLHRSRFLGVWGLAGLERRICDGFWRRKVFLFMGKLRG